MATITITRPDLAGVETSNNGKLVTGDELFAMGDIGRTELIEGRIFYLMPTGYKHGIYEANVMAELHYFVKKRKIGRVLGGEVGIYIRRNPDSVRGVDAAFISHERYNQIQSESYLDVCPELLIEVLSPDDSWSNVHTKLGEYFSVHAQMIWVIDPKLQQIHVYRSLDDVTRLTIDDELSGEEVLPEFRVPVRDIFEMDGEGSQRVQPT